MTLSLFKSGDERAGEVELQAGQFFEDGFSDPSVLVQEVAGLEVVDVFEFGISYPAVEAWVVGERNKRSSGDSEKRTRKKPLKYVESSDSENDFDGMVDSDETDEEFEEEKKRKKTKPGKAPLKKPNKTQTTENSAAKIKRGNNPPSEVVKQSKVLEKNSISSGGQHKADPASPLRPLGIHNPSSPSRPSALSF